MYPNRHVVGGVAFGLIAGLLVHVAVRIEADSLLYDPSPFFIAVDVIGIRTLFGLFPPAGYVVMAAIGGILGLVYGAIFGRPR